MRTTNACDPWRVPMRPFVALVGVVMIALGASSYACAGRVEGSEEADARRSIPSPEQFFGFAIGAERKLAPLETIYEYLTLIDQASDRVVVREYGQTAMGKPMLLAVISTPDTVANLAEQQRLQRQLADPRSTSDDEAARIVRDAKGILLIETAQHSNEVSSHLMAIKLLHKLATEMSPWVDQALKNLVILMIPVGNPDGHKMIVDWAARNAGTPYDGSGYPELWHKYIGHDNNRENFMQTQPETQALNRLLFKEWLPDVYLNVHNTGSGNARIFVPPYDVPNPNVDPVVWSELNLYGQAMAASLFAEGKQGVVWGEFYTGLQEGTNMRAPLWRNAIGILTETALSPQGITIEQEMPAAEVVSEDRRSQQNVATSGDASGVIKLPPPRDVQARMRYPRPWVGGRWTLADAVDYQFVSTIGLIETFANNREMRKRNYYAANKRTLAQYKSGFPYAYIVPPDQRDPVVSAKLLETLQLGGAEVHRAEAALTADGVTYPAGTYVVLLAQPFGRWVKNLLEVQRWPKHEIAAIRAGGRGVAWTLGMLMGVRTVRVERPFDAKLTLMQSNVEAKPGEVSGNGPTSVLDHAINNSFTAMNRLLKVGAEVSWARDEFRANGRTYAPGAILVTGASPDTQASIARELKVNIERTDSPVPATALKIRAPRLALYEPWSGGNAESAMDAGWTRWLLEQHQFPYTHARNSDLRQSGLRERFDVVLLPNIETAELVAGPDPRRFGGDPTARIRPEYAGGIGDEGVRNVREFVEQGGTLITLGASADFVADRLQVPVRRVIEKDSDEFFCPGSILKVAVDTRHPVGYGMPEEADAMVEGPSVYAATGSQARFTTIARYPNAPLLRSGLIVGEERIRGAGAVLEVTLGRGRVLMHTFRVQHRAQTVGTFKLLFNSILYGAAMARVAPATNGTQSTQ